MSGNAGKGSIVRAIWNGVISFGLVAVQVRLYAATSNHDVRFHQVHEADGGRIRYRRFCEQCGAEVPYEDIVKGHETPEGELITLDEDDLARVPTGSTREISVLEFVPAEQVDPLLLDRSYYLEPGPQSVKPYTLLREVLRTSDRMAVAKVALRERESLAVLRVRGQAIVLQTMLWPDEVREPDFPPLRAEVSPREEELRMASTLVETLSTDFDPSRYDDEYTKAVRELLEQKRQRDGGAAASASAEDAGSHDGGSDGEPVTDLLAALKRSVEQAAAGADHSDDR